MPPSNTPQRKYASVESRREIKVAYAATRPPLRTHLCIQQEEEKSNNNKKIGVTKIMAALQRRYLGDGRGDGKRTGRAGGSPYFIPADRHAARRHRISNRIASNRIKVYNQIPGAAPDLAGLLDAKVVGGSSRPHCNLCRVARR